MAELPSIPNVTPEVRAPQPRVNPDQIEQPYNELAANLDKAGQIAMQDIAEPAATRAGLQAVTRDAAGNPQIDHYPIFGDAGVAFHKAVTMAALADGEGTARRDDIALRTKFRDNPQGYLVAAEAYRQAKIDQYSDLAGPHVGVALGKVIDAQTTQTFKGLQNEFERLELQRSVLSLQTGLKSSQDDAIAMVRQGAPLNGPDVGAPIGKWQTLLKTLVGNPRLAYPTEKADSDVQNFRIQLGTAKFLHDKIDPVLANNPALNADKAMDAADAVMNDQSLSPVERQVYHDEAVKTIKEAIQNNNIRNYNAEKQRRAADDGWENKIILDSASKTPQITDNDIKNNPEMSPQSKMRMLAWRQRENSPEPLPEISHNTSMDLFRRMNLPDGDPNKLANLDAVREAYAPPDGSSGRLTRVDEEWLEKRFVETRSDQGQRLNDIRKQFGSAVSPLIDRSNPLMGKIDESGKLQNYQFERFVDMKIEEYRAAKKNPADLFNPSKDDYIGKPEIISQFQKPLQSSINDAVRNLTKPVPSVLPAPPTGVRGASNIAVPNALWGNPLDPSFAQTHLTTVQTPSGQTATVNKVSAPAFQGFLQELEKSGYKISSLAGYNLRAIAGTGSASQHAFGNAVDINPDRNPVTLTGNIQSDLPANVGEMAARYGISWGGDWKTKKDPMHFEYVGGGAAQSQNSLTRQPNESVAQYLSRTGRGL